MIDEINSDSLRFSKSAIISLLLLWSLKDPVRKSLRKKFFVIYLYKHQATSLRKRRSWFYLRRLHQTEEAPVWGAYAFQQPPFIGNCSLQRTTLDSFFPPRKVNFAYFRLRGKRFFTTSRLKFRFWSVEFSFETELIFSFFCSKNTDFFWSQV